MSVIVLSGDERRRLIQAAHTADRMGCACDAVLAAIEHILARRAEAADDLRRMLDDERAAKKVAADSADRFRDVLSECLGHDDENPGDDVLVAELRDHFGKTGPEPTRWRDFCSGALAVVDQINAYRAEPTTDVTP